MLLVALRQRNTTLADLARVLACWLVVVLLVQGFAALQTLVRGPSHRHAAVQLRWEQPASLKALQAAVPAQPQGVRTAESLLEPPDPRQAAAASEAAHRAAHDSGRAHHHAADRVSIPADADAAREAALDTAACVLMATLAPLWVSHGWPPVTGRSALGAGSAWALIERVCAPPRRPPRG